MPLIRVVHSYAWLIKTDTYLVSTAADAITRQPTVAFAKLD